MDLLPERAVLFKESWKRDCLKTSQCKRTIRRVGLSGRCGRRHKRQNLIRAPTDENTIIATVKLYPHCAEKKGGTRSPMKRERERGPMLLKKEGNQASPMSG